MRFNSGHQYLGTLFDDQDTKGVAAGVAAGVGAVAVAGLGELHKSIRK